MMGFLPIWSVFVAAGLAISMLLKNVGYRSDSTEPTPGNTKDSLKETTQSKDSLDSSKKIELEESSLVQTSWRTRRGKR